MSESITNSQCVFYLTTLVMMFAYWLLPDENGNREGKGPPPPKKNKRQNSYWKVI